MYQCAKSKRDMSRTDSIIIRWPVLCTRLVIRAPYAGAVFNVIVGCTGVQVTASGAANDNNFVNITLRDRLCMILSLGLNKIHTGEALI